MQRPQVRAAGAVVFRRTERGPRLLLLRASVTWDFPMGLVEPGEGDLDCARRAVFEVTGLADVDYPFGEEHRETLPYANHRIARYYLAETETAEIRLPVSAERGRPGYDEWRWVSFEAAEDLLPPRLAIVLDWARQTITGN